MRTFTPALLVLVLLMVSTLPTLTAHSQPDPSKDVYCNGCNDIGKRNIEMGWNADHNGDVSAVGRLTICWDQCSHGFAIGNGQHQIMLKVGHRCVWIVGHHWCR